MKNAYTLIELLIVISILAILGVFAYANYGSLKKDQDLKSAASDLQSRLRLAQANATSRFRCGVDTSSGANWIVEFETDQKTIKSYCQVQQTPPASPTPTFTADIDRTLVLKNNVTVNSILVGSCSTTLPVSVTFAPLTGGVSFSQPCASGSPNMTITLVDSSGNTKTVTINKGGSIDIAEGVTISPPPILYSWPNCNQRSYSYPNTHSYSTSSCIQSFCLQYQVFG